MKKTLLSAAAFAVVAVSAVAVAPTTSEAIPAFARQTGAACLSCHFQTFPAINSFGRSFKLNAFTDVGEEALVEDDNLSLPSVLNMAFVLRAQVQQVKTSAAGAASTTVTNYNIPADAVLLIAGRVGAHTGAFVEFGTNPAGAPGAANWQLMNSFDFDGFKGGVNVQNTGFGPTAALEISNVFGQHGGKLNGKAISAVENVINGAGTNSTSVVAWAANDMFVGQVGGVALASAPGLNSPRLLPMARVNGIFDLGGSEAIVGAGWINGVQTANGAVLAGADALFVDAQVQGDIGDASFGIYADYVTTKSKAANGGTALNIFAGSTNAKRDGFSIRGEVKPTHSLMFGLGYGTDKTKPVGAVSTKNTNWQVAATYEIYQNMEINLFYLNNKNGTTTTKTTFGEVEALF